MIPGYARGRVAEYVVQAAGQSTEFVRVDGTAPMEADLDCNSNQVVSLAAPTDATDAATKSYVDGLAPTASSVGTGLGYKGRTRILLSGMTLSGGNVVRYDGGTALTVVASATPSATQIGVSSTGTGVLVIEDGSSSLLNTPTNLLLDNEFIVNYGNVLLQPPRFVTTAANEMTITFLNPAGGNTNLVGNCCIEIWHRV